MMRINRQTPRQRASFFSFSSSNGEYAREAYFIINEDPLSYIPAPDGASRQDLIMKIVGFIPCAVMALLYQIDDREAYLLLSVRLQTFILFLLVAFCASLAAIASCREQSKTMFQRIAIVAIALALASIASMFLHVWVQLAAYVVCALPVYASAQSQINRWFGEVLMVLRRIIRRKECSASETEGVQVDNHSDCYV